MFFFFAKRCLPKPRRGWFSSAVTGLGVAIQWLAFVSSLWCILLKALSPNTKTFITPITIHPLSSASSLFTNPPTPPSKAAKAIKPPRRDEQVESTPKPSSVALFVCFAVAHTLARRVPDVLDTQRKPAVSDGRGIEESLDILNPPSDEESLRKPAVVNGRGIEESLDILNPPSDEESLRKPAVVNGRGIEESLDTLNPPSDEESLRKPAVVNGRGIEESSDVNTTVIRESISNEGNVNTNEKADKDHEHDDQGILSTADTSVTNTHDVKESVALAILYALAAAEKTHDEQLRALAERLQWHHTRHVTQEATTQKSTDLGNVEQTGTHIEVTTEKLESTESKHEDQGDIAESEKSIESDEDVEAKDYIKEATEMDEETEVIDNQDEETDECTTAEAALDATREIESADVELKDDVEQTKDIEDAKVIDDQDTEDWAAADVELKDDVEQTKDIEDAEVIDDQDTEDWAAADASDAECETETEEHDVDAAKSNDVQAVAKPEEDASQDAEEDDDDGDWFTICRGKAVKTSSRVVPPPVPVPALATSEAVETPTSSSTVAASEENLAKVSTPESRSTATETCSQDKERHTVRHAEKLPAVPFKPQVKPSQRVCSIVPAGNPNWLENKAERYRKAMEAWNAFKEAERAVERAKAEEEERKVREVEEAKTARIAKFDTTMSRLDGLLKAAREAKQKWEQQKKENEKTIKEIGSAQNRIGEMIDMEKVRAMFDPEILKTSSFSSVVGPSVVRQKTAIPEPVVAPSSSSAKHTDKGSDDDFNTLQQNAAERPGPSRVLPCVGHGAARSSKTTEKTASVDKSSALQQNTADRPGPSKVLPARTSKTIEKPASVDNSSALKQDAAQVLPSNWGVRYGTVRKSKTIERRLRRRRNELRRRNAEAGLSSNGGGGGDDDGDDGESPERDGA